MSSITENGKVDNKGAQDDGESGEPKPAGIPDLVQSQDGTQQNLLMSQGDSLSEEARDTEKDKRIAELEEQIKQYKNKEKEWLNDMDKMKEGFDKLSTEIDVLHPVQTGNPQAIAAGPDAPKSKLHAELCTEFIFDVLHSTTMKQQGISPQEPLCLSKENDIDRIPESTGLYVLSCRANSNGSTINYPVYVGVSLNFRTALSNLRWTIDTKTKTSMTLKSLLGTAGDFPKNKKQIVGLEYGVYVHMVTMIYAASNFLKESLLQEFDFCLNTIENNVIRMDIDTSDQISKNEVDRNIARNGKWNKGIVQCVCMLRE